MVLLSPFYLLSDHGKELISHMLPKYIKKETLD